VTVVLAIASATTQVSVAIGDPDSGVVGETTLRQGRRHGEVLAPAIESLCRLSDVSLSEVQMIGVDLGPGLFTGLRVGVATAKALASALAVPMVVVSSLDLLAHPLRFAGRNVVSVIDARRGEVFSARYRPGRAGMARSGEAEVLSPDALAARLANLVDDNGLLIVGDGARRYADTLAGVPGVAIAGPAFDHPRASTLIELVPGLPLADIDRVTPTYLRGADVRIGWEERRV
jgi:tRNA threonylcarbamoyladenosine biosynthesis protein TsaB